MFPTWLKSAPAALALAGGMAIGLSAGPAAAIVAVPTPDVFTTYHFVGDCSDCFLRVETLVPQGAAAFAPPVPGVGEAFLTVKNYTEGTGFTTDNFVSFAYSSVILTYDSSAPGEVLQDFSGQIPGPLAGPGDIVLDFLNSTGAAPVATHFEAFNGGNWCFSTNGGCAVPQDQGVTYDISAVPEPGTMALLGLGLLGLGAARRRAR